MPDRLRAPGPDPGQRIVAVASSVVGAACLRMVRIRARNDEGLVDARIAAGKDPQDLFEELTREANGVFGHYNPEPDWQECPATTDEDDKTDILAVVSNDEPGA